MNYYCYLSLTVKEINTGLVGIVVDVIGDSLCVEFPFGHKWLKEYEIIAFD